MKADSVKTKFGYRKVIHSQTNEVIANDNHFMIREVEQILPLTLKKFTSALYKQLVFLKDLQDKS